MVRSYEALSHSSLALISSLATPSGFYAATSCIVLLASHPPQRNAWWGRSLPRAGMTVALAVGSPQTLACKGDRARDLKGITKGARFPSPGPSLSGGVTFAR